MSSKAVPRDLRQPQAQLTPVEQMARWYRRHREAVIAWSFLIPMLVYFVAMTYVPLAFLIGISFTDWNIITPPRWVGLQNFQIIFSDYRNWFYLKVIGRTVLYAVAILFLNIAGGFFTALVLNQNLRGKGIFRTMWYLPAVFSGAVIALLLRIYLAPSTQGVLNMLLFNVGIGPIDWYRSTVWMPIITVLFSVWQGIGFTVIFFLAGLQGIDENLYDAAKIDGANNRQLLWYITIPQMLPVLLFISVTGMIGSMQMWEVPKIITAGGPNDLTYTLIYSIHNDSFGALEMGLGTAQSFVLFIMLLIFIGWQLHQYRKEYGV
ncbi:MAG: sugar ABC transporter permease [Caldilineaceae bacterium]|nr:sugar ABC transporter permease [Caldilineaceae bacterium]